MKKNLKRPAKDAGLIDQDRVMTLLSLPKRNQQTILAVIRTNNVVTVIEAAAIVVSIALRAVTMHNERQMVNTTETTFLSLS